MYEYQWEETEKMGEVENIVEMATLIGDTRLQFMQNKVMVW